jgi:hypothetical protein
MFTAATMAVSAPPTPTSAPSRPPAPMGDDTRRRDDFDADDDRPSRRGRYEDDDDGDLEYGDVRRRRRGNYAPHRGGLILSLGLVGLVGGWLCVLPVILGPIAWIMGNADMREIRAGRMDPSGESSTRAGQVCGMIATGFLILAVLVVCLIIAADIIQH